MRPLSVGAGRGGSTGEEPPSNVELVEKAGDAGCFDARLLSNPSSAFAAGGGDEFNEEIVAWNVNISVRRVFPHTKTALTTRRPAQTILKSSATESLRSQRSQAYS